MIELYCVNCQVYPPHSRGLCARCYNNNNRAGTLGDFPTQKYWDDPESHIYWGFTYNMEIVENAAIEFSKAVIDLDEYIEFTKWKDQQMLDQQS